MQAVDHRARGGRVRGVNRWGLLRSADRRKQLSTLVQRNFSRRKEHVQEIGAFRVQHRSAVNVQCQISLVRVVAAVIRELTVFRIRFHPLGVFNVVHEGRSPRVQGFEQKETGHAPHDLGGAGRSTLLARQVAQHIEELRPSRRICDSRKA